MVSPGDRDMTLPRTFFATYTSRMGQQGDTHPELEDARILLGETLIQGDDSAQEVLVQSQSLQSSQEPAVA